MIDQVSGRPQVISPGVERAALALRLDAATAAVVQALSRSSIPSVLLKGPAVVYWLYPDDPGERAYGDVDLAVRPSDFERAESVLRGLGFQSPLADLNGREKAWLMETAWVGPSSSSPTVDLHRGFHGVSDWEAWWDGLFSHSVEVVIGGGGVRIPDEAGCALIVALHDADVYRNEQSAEDLRRALHRFEMDVWAVVAGRAATAEALFSLSLALSLHHEGRRLSAALDLPGRLPFEVAARADVAVTRNPLHVGRAGVLAHRLSRATGWRDQVTVLRDLAFPSATIVRYDSRLARRGRWGLLLVRLGRPFALAAHAPPVVHHLVRGKFGRRGVSR